jgi:hypothetical protein
VTDLERAIADTVARAKGAGLEPKSIYATPDDFAELERLGHCETIGGLAVKRSAGKGSSRLYCRRGIHLQVTSRPKRPLRPYALPSTPASTKAKKARS